MLTVSALRALQVRVGSAAAPYFQGRLRFSPAGGVVNGRNKIALVSCHQAAGRVDGFTDTPHVKSGILSRPLVERGLFAFPGLAAGTVRTKIGSGVVLAAAAAPGS